MLETPISESGTIKSLFHFLVQSHLHTSIPCETGLGCSNFLLSSTEISDTISILWCLANLQMVQEWDRGISSVIKARLPSYLYTPSWAQTHDMCPSLLCTIYCSGSNPPPSLPSPSHGTISVSVLEIAKSPVYLLQGPLNSDKWTLSTALHTHTKSSNNLGPI